MNSYDNSSNYIRRQNNVDPYQSGRTVQSSRDPGQYGRSQGQSTQPQGQPTRNQGQPSPASPPQGQSGGKFERLRATYAREGRLYDDPEFPAGGSTITNPSVGKLRPRNVVWKRPREIVNNPRFVTDGASQFDLNQGAIKDCWFVAATACLAATRPKMLQRCVPSDQDFTNNYAGIFRFYFWFYDEWKEIIIDDKLPTVGGKLLFASNNSQPDEFWVPLFEKAYAKLYGCYENLEGGFVNYAVVDFTGGISEMMDIKKMRSDSVQVQNALYDRLYSGMTKSSVIGCHIDATRIPEEPLPNGLYSAHAYSITNLVKLKIRDKTIRLMCLRNPWGRGEWNGAWRDSSPEWANIPDKVKKEVGMAVREDGAFWMSFEDWLSNFEFLTLCHLSPDAVTRGAEEDTGRELWQEEKHMAKWERGFSAGGCGNPPYEDLFWRNPQFGVSLTAGSGVNGPGSKGQKCHMVISLMQKSYDLRIKYAISLFLYQLREGVQLLEGRDYSSNSVLLAQSAPTFTNLREVTVHYDVPPGNYIIIPCTYEPNQEIEFLLRVYTEVPVTSQLMDVTTQMSKPVAPKEDLGALFMKFSNGEDKMDSQELSNALNSLLIAEGFTKFGMEISRCLLSMMDKDKSGLLSVDEFRTLVTELRFWKDKFERYDNGKSGTIDTYELVQLFDSIGFQISRKVQQAIIRRYGGKQTRLSLIDFLHCASKLVSLHEQFVSFSSGGKSRDIQLSLEEFLSTTLYY